MRRKLRVVLGGVSRPLHTQPERQTWTNLAAGIVLEKTRLALEAAAAALDGFEHGVCFVALASISDPSLVAATIAQTLGVRVPGSGMPLDSLKSFLRDRQLLLVIDNFEQVLGAAFEISELLVSCPRLSVMVTSLAALRLSAERELLVQPLVLPDAPEASRILALETCLSTSAHPCDCSSIAPRRSMATLR
jgi:predicted ATPase